jgi:hypothetical protein
MLHYANLISNFTSYSSFFVYIDVHMQKDTNEYYVTCVWDGGVVHHCLAQ